MERGALISRCGFYRYSLYRRWGGGDPVLFLMLNPSTADHFSDDPTIRKCIGFARRLGYGALLVGNLFAYRATDPKDLLEAHRLGEGPVGPLNDDHLRLQMGRAASTIVAWGGLSAPLRWRVPEVLELLRGREVNCLGLSKDGQPFHPSRLAYSTQLRSYLAADKILLPPLCQESDVPW